MFKVIEDFVVARPLYDAGLLWYRIRPTEDAQFKGTWMTPVPPWWKPSRYTGGCAQFALLLEE